jgi:hypothetical protein
VDPNNFFVFIQLYYLLVAKLAIALNLAPQLPLSIEERQEVNQLGFPYPDNHLAYRVFAGEFERVL